jgi:predicted permease
LNSDSNVEVAVISDFLFRLRALVRRKPMEAELDEELRAHLEHVVEEYIQSGMSRGEAFRRARLEFGGLDQVKEECRDARGVNFVETTIQDLRYALRLLRKSPGFTVVAVVSLCLGIGANTAIFQLLDAVRLRSLPVANPHELVEVRIVGGNRGMGLNNGTDPKLTRPIWQEIEKRHEPFSGVFASETEDLRVGRGSESRRASGILVSGEFFRVLGVQPWRGRLILPEDEGACPASKAVVSYSYWQGQMGGREIGAGPPPVGSGPQAGATLVVDGELMEVVGVTPPRFFGVALGESFDIAIPFCQPKEGLRREVFEVTVMGRLRPGWTIERASAQLSGMSPGIFAATVPAGYSSQWIETYKRFRLAAYPGAGGVSWPRTEYDPLLALLMGITGLVLLIACANLANLMLARASTREHEVAVRLALGASRGRLLCQLLTESALLAAIGGTLGIGLAQFLSGLLVWSFSTQGTPVYLPMATDWRVLLFAATVAASTCALFGLVPALRANNTEPVNAMKTGDRRTTDSRERFSMQRLMVVTQIAVSLVLLVGAFLFVRSFRNLLTLDPGMRAPLPSSDLSRLT